MVKNMPSNERDAGLSPGMGRPPAERNGNPLCILAWEIPWIEEPGGLQSMGSQRIRHILVTKQQSKNNSIQEHPSAFEGVGVGD